MSDKEKETWYSNLIRPIIKGIKHSIYISVIFIILGTLCSSLFNISLKAVMKDYVSKEFGQNSYLALDNGDLPVFKGYRLSADDQLRQFVIMELMSNFSLNISRVEKEFGINFKEYFDDALKALEEFEQAELITVGDEKIEVSQTGTMLIRNICMPFDAYLNNIPEDKRRFSKTI